MATDQKQKVIEWLFSDDTGLSSMSLAAEFLGVECEINYPHDPSDFGRCQRLIMAVPDVRKSVDSLAEKSPHWKKLSEHWDNIAEKMDFEVGFFWQKGRSAPRTYEFMQEILK